MKTPKIFICAIFLSLLNCCSSDDSPSDTQIKQYDVEYQVTSSGIVNEVSYRTKNGDTLIAHNISSGWKYAWVNKGNSGDTAYIKIILTNTAADAHFRIVGNNMILDADSIQGTLNGIVTGMCMTTLPY